MLPAGMLFPPGIKNQSNICFASSSLHCLLNQQVFTRVTDSAKVHHSSRCSECQQEIALQTNSMTYYNYDTTQVNHTGGLLIGGLCTCVIAALHCLKQKYKYKQTTSGQRNQPFPCVEVRGASAEPFTDYRASRRS